MNFRSLPPHFKISDFPLHFADYMQQALYHPQYGYYHQDREIIGEKGDFMTAPEISSIFSQCLANAIVSNLNNPQESLEAYNILELGAGNGTMAFDMLTHWQSNNTLPHRYQILELSDTLKKKQQSQLSSLPYAMQRRIEWIEQLPNKAEKRIILANEVLDALPCNVGRIRKKNHQWHWCEHQVKYEDGYLQWHECEPSSTLPDSIQTAYCVDERIIEIPQNLLPWLQALRKTVTSGFFFVIDYADYDKALQQTHPQGTLRCYQSHQTHHNPFINVGQQDITYHLNIDLLATQLKKSDWELDTIETQAHFLLGNGIENIDIRHTKSSKRWQLAKEIEQLTSPMAMGERYKVMQCLASPTETNL